MSVEIIIPERFKINDYSIRLKDQLSGIIIYNEKIKGSYFQSDSHNIKIRLGEDDWSGRKTLKDVKRVILDIYLKGIEDKSLLTANELPIFYFIQHVVVNSNNKKKILYIGYKGNYPITIKNTLSRFGVNCDIHELDKNIELYDDEYQSIMASILKKVNKSIYDKIVFDVPNMYIKNNDYTKTKSALETLSNIDKKLLVLVEEPVDKFLKIFGEKYKDIILNRKYAVYCGSDTITSSTIKRVLF